MARQNRYPREAPEQAVRMVFEHAGELNQQWAAIVSIAGKIGCTPETLRNWIRPAERDEGSRPGLTTDERAKLKELEREVRELRRHCCHRRDCILFAPASQCENNVGGPSTLLRAGFDAGHGKRVERTGCGPATPPTEEVIRFVDEHRGVHGVEPICRMVKIAPSNYYESKKREI